MDAQVRCYACGSSVEHYPEYFRCQSCGLVRSIYHYDSSIYSSEYARTYQCYARSECNTQLMLARLGLVATFIQPGSKLLDFGTALGEFMKVAKPYYHVEGFEPNKEAVKRSSMAPIHTDLSLLRHYDAITFFDVLEHIEDPQGLLQLVKKYHLLPGGYIFIITPSASAAEGHDKLVNWKHFKPREHLFLYTLQSLEAVIEQVGFHAVHWEWNESLIRPGNSNSDLLTCVAKVG